MVSIDIILFYTGKYVVTCMRHDNKHSNTL